MLYDKNDIGIFATSNEFIEWLTNEFDETIEDRYNEKYQYEEIKNVFDEFKTIFCELDYHSNNWTYTGAEAIWYQDKNKVRRFILKFIDKKAIGNQFRLVSFYSIHKIFGCDNVLSGEDIYRLIPMNPNKIICWVHPHNNNSYIYYETETEVFDLDLWSMLIPYVHAHGSWRPSRIHAKRMKDVIEFSGFARRDYRRFYYEDFNYEATFNTVTGGFILNKGEFESGSYK